MAAHQRVERAGWLGSNEVSPQRAHGIPASPADTWKSNVGWALPTIYRGIDKRWAVPTLRGTAREENSRLQSDSRRRRTACRRNQGDLRGPAAYDRRHTYRQPRVAGRFNSPTGDAAPSRPHSGQPLAHAGPTS